MAKVARRLLYRHYPAVWSRYGHQELRGHYFSHENRGNMSSEASQEKKTGSDGAQRIDTTTSEAILVAIGSLRYGSVEVTVHDGRVVMIDKRERIRLAAGGH